MALPISPVIKERNVTEIKYAEHQHQYQTLPAVRLNDEQGTIVTRWNLTWRERLAVLRSGDIYLWMMTFNKPLQPVLLTADPPEVNQDTIALKSR